MLTQIMRDEMLLHDGGEAEPTNSRGLDFAENMYIPSFPDLTFACEYLWLYFSWDWF